MSVIEVLIIRDCWTSATKTLLWFDLETMGTPCVNVNRYLCFQ